MSSHPVLVWKNKYDAVLIDAIDESEAYHELFLLVDESGYYADLESEVAWELLEEQKQLYRLAKAGQRWASAKLLRLRRKYEYEGFYLENLVTPRSH